MESLNKSIGNGDEVREMYTRDGMRSPLHKSINNETPCSLSVPSFKRSEIQQRRKSKICQQIVMCHNEIVHGQLSIQSGAVTDWGPVAAQNGAKDLVKDKCSVPKLCIMESVFRLVVIAFAQQFLLGQ